MPSFWNVPWLNSNSQRSYPFAESATKFDVSNTIQIPDDFMVELYWPVGNVLGLKAELFFIKTLGILGAGFLVELGYDDGSDAPPTVASTSIPSTNTAENTRYALAGINDFDDSVGKIVIGRLNTVRTLPAGIYNFTPAGGALDPDCIRPIVRGVSAIVVDQNGQLSTKLRDQIVFEGGNNISISVIQRAGQLPIIRFDAVLDTSFTTACDCTETLPPCIRTINDISGDAKQNFTLVGDPCIELNPIGYGLQILDRCCQPCCGDTELQEVLRGMQSLRNSAATIASFQQRLDAAMVQLQLNLALSGLRGCGACA
jgi:hypothetical protein